MDRTEKIQKLRDKQELLKGEIKTLVEDNEESNPKVEGKIRKLEDKVSKLEDEANNLDAQGKELDILDNKSKGFSDFLFKSNKGFDKYDKPFEYEQDSLDAFAISKHIKNGRSDKYIGIRYTREELLEVGKFHEIKVSNYKTNKDIIKRLRDGRRK